MQWLENEKVSEKATDDVPLQCPGSLPGRRCGEGCCHTGHSRWSDASLGGKTVVSARTQFWVTKMAPTTSSYQHWLGLLSGRRKRVCAMHQMAFKTWQHQATAGSPLHRHLTTKMVIKECLGIDSKAIFLTLKFFPHPTVFFLKETCWRGSAIWCQKQHKDLGCNRFWVLPQFCVRDELDSICLWHLCIL